MFLAARPVGPIREMHKPIFSFRFIRRLPWLLLLILCAVIASTAFREGWSLIDRGVEPRGRSVATAAIAPTTPTLVDPAPVPGTIQIEDFDEGVNGGSYRDNSAGNAGGQYRATDVDIELTSDTGGGFSVGWVSAGEWLKYHGRRVLCGPLRSPVPGGVVRRRRYLPSGSQRRQPHWHAQRAEQRGLAALGDRGQGARRSQRRAAGLAPCDGLERAGEHRREFQLRSRDREPGFEHAVRRGGGNGTGDRPNGEFRSR